MKNSIKLILTDMDGTLLNDDKQMPKNIFEIIKKCTNEGIIVGAASGRQLYNLYNRFNETQYEMFFVAENGSYATYKNKIIYFSQIKLPVIHELIDVARTLHNAYPIACGKKGAYIENTDKKFVLEAKEYYDKLTLVDDLKSVEDDFCKFTICDFDGSEFNSNLKYEAFKEKLQITVSGQIWLDICNKGVCKGKAVEAFQEKMKIAKEQTMAFGDYMNDVTLLQAAHYSYAMQNSHLDLFQYANYIAPNNNDEGVVQIVEQYLK